MKDQRYPVQPAPSPGAEPTPTDYQLLIPREWFRVDLTQDRWRGQLKTFVDQQAKHAGVPADVTRNVWAALRNTAEAGRTRGAMEFYLLTTGQGGGVPASLLVSLMPLAETPVDPKEYAARLQARASERGTRREVSVVDLPAGAAVRVLGATALNFHVQMPGGKGYLVLSFKAPVSGVSGPMGQLCDAMAGSLRWVM